MVKRGNENDSWPTTHIQANRLKKKKLQSCRTHVSLPPRLKWERTGELGGGGLGAWIENNLDIVLLHFQKIQWINWIVVQYIIYYIIEVIYVPFSCWWRWMDWRKNGHALSRQNMWQNTADPYGVQRHYATNVNSTVWFGASKFEIFYFLFGVTVVEIIQLTVNIFLIMQYIKPHKSHGKRKRGMISRTPSANSQRPLSATRKRERRCTLEDCRNFSCRGVYSFVIDYDDTLAKLVVMPDLQR